MQVLEAFWGNADMFKLRKGMIVGTFIWSLGFLNVSYAAPVKVFLPFARPLCGDLKDQNDIVLNSDLFGYIRGYLSGAAVYSGKDILRKTNTDAIQKWLFDYCRLHPAANMSDAMIALVDAL